MKKAANILSDILIAVLLIALAGVLVMRFVFDMEFKAVLTGSMEPELPVGSLLVIKPVSYGEINIGDDITYVSDKNLTLVTHRVVAKDDGTREITTKGLANNMPDAPTIYENVVGKVIFHIPVVGYLVIWTSTLRGKIIAFIIIAAAVALSILFSGDAKAGGGKNKSENEETS